MAVVHARLHTRAVTTRYTTLDAMIEIGTASDRELYPTMLNEINCTFGVGLSRLHFHCCDRHGHGLV